PLTTFSSTANDSIALQHLTDTHLAREPKSPALVMVREAGGNHALPVCPIEHDATSTSSDKTTSLAELHMAGFEKGLEAPELLQFESLVDLTANTPPTERLVTALARLHIGDASDFAAELPLEYWPCIAKEASTPAPSVTAPPKLEWNSFTELAAPFAAP